MNNTKHIYKDKIIKTFTKVYKYKSIMQIPKIEKVTLNIGINQKSEKNFLSDAMTDLKYISGQKPMTTKAKKSIAGFNIRQGQIVGCKVTLRNNRMWNFLKKLVCIILPRIRDFRGLSERSFDKNGNYNIGIKEQIIFPEIDYSKINKIYGLNITITTSARSNKEGKMLLTTINFPFKNKDVV